MSGMVFVTLLWCLAVKVCVEWPFISLVGTKLVMF